ncbi:hypothetical protein Tco_0381524 [Tanacetum coccineum]
MNKKSYSFDLDTFTNMLQICPKLPGQHFVDTPFEEDILAFMRELGYFRTIKLLSYVKVYLLPQPWRTFATIINECLSDLVYQIENKESRKNKYMYYPRFTKVIINHFMSQDQSIPRSNKVDCHMPYDDPILTTMRFIPQHEVVQPKPKYVRRSSRTKTDDVPKPSSGKRVKATAKGTCPILLTLKKLMEDMLPLEVAPNEGKSKAELTDESRVLLKVPRKDNIYSIDLKNIVPKGGLTFLFAKAISDESKLWHRRLGHINSKL